MQVDSAKINQIGSEIRGAVGAGGMTAEEQLRFAQQADLASPSRSRVMDALQQQSKQRKPEHG
jgi:hypothetical protein